MKTALLVIDVQESFRHRPYFDERALPAYLAAQNRLILQAQPIMPVIRVFHVEGPDLVSNPFSTASGHIKPLVGLTSFDAAAEFVKSRHSALVGTGLDVWLTQQGIGRIIVSGIRTEQCCETTTRHASDLGWEVDFVSEATHTFDIPVSQGPALSVSQIKGRTEAVLHGRFCTVVSIDEAISRSQNALLPKAA